MPRKLVRRSPMSISLSRKRRNDRLRRALAVLDRADRQIEPAAHAIAAGPHFWQAGAPFRIDDDLAALHRRRRGAEQGAGLADGGEHDVGLQPERRAVADEPAALEPRALEQYARHRAALALQPDRLRPGSDRHAVRLRQFALVEARLHVLD